MIYAVLYVLLIVLCNVGFAYAPPINVLGVMWPPMSLAVGLVFVARDFAQRGVGHGVLFAMLAGAGLSYVMASPAIAIASLVAFAISEFCDWLVYTVSNRPFRERVLLSSALSAPVDSIFFLALIGHLSAAGVVVMALSKMLGAYVIYLLAKPVTWDQWRGNATPVMWVKRLAKLPRGWQIDLHKFVAADDAECFHTHPAYCVRIVLAGGYVEEVEGNGLRTWRPGMVGLVRPELSHRVNGLLAGPSYSLWLRGPNCAKVALRGAGWAKGAVARPNGSSPGKV